MPPWIDSGRARSHEVDLRWARALHRGAARPQLVSLFSVFSRLGGPLTWVLVLLALPWLGGARGPALAWSALGLGAANLLLYWGLKRSTRRERPFRQCQDIRECVVADDLFSFPSGHALHACAYAALLSGAFPALAPWLWSFAALVALSRVVLGVHFPSDVLAGAAIGMTTGSLAWWLT